MGRVKALAAAGMATFAVGCSAARPPPAHTKEAPITDSAATSYVSPARWDYHPPAPLSPLGAALVPGGGCVFTAEGGQRWTAKASRTAGSRIVCSGAAEASFNVAPEDLTSVVRRENGAWLFVGEGGTLYEASEPLGAFARTIQAPEPFAKVAGVGQAVIAATQDGRVMRWDPAKGWGSSPPPRALAGAHVFDLAATAGSPRVLALAFPEALFASEDEGVTFRAVAAPPIGARRLGSTGAGELGAQGIADSIVWRGGAFVRGSERLLVPTATLAVEVGRAPTVFSIQQGHAVLDGDRYAEVVAPVNDGDPWLLARGRLEGRLETAPLADTARCSNLHIGARGAFVILACITTEDGQARAELRRSKDRGATWSEPLAFTTPDTEQTAIAIAPDGSALVTGVCRSSEESGTCKPTAPFLLKDDDAASAPDAGTTQAGGDLASDAGPRRDPAPRVVPASAPQLSGVALSPAFSLDGRSAYFLGKRGKDDRYGIFVSHDAGASFSPRSLQAAIVAHLPRRSDDDEGPPEGDGPEPLEIDESSSLKPGEDGTVGITALRARGVNVYVTTDEDGRVREVAGPPLDEDNNPAEVFFAGFGARVLALPQYLVGDGTSGVLWESVDGGVNWDKQTMPQALVREYSKNNMAAACSAAGCLLGDTVARVGWGGGPDAAGTGAAPDTPPDPDRRVLTPIVCEMSAKDRWVRVDGVVVPDGATSRAPGPRELMRGRSAWSALTVDPATGAAVVLSAEVDGHVVKRPLLGARGKNTATALVTYEPDGYAALRATFAADGEGKPAPGASLRNLELAWDDLVDGAAGHARVADAGPVASGDVRVTAGAATLIPSLVAVRPGGLLVRVHASRPKEPGEEIFVDERGRAERHPAPPLPTQSPLGGLEPRPDATTVDGAPLDLGVLPDDGHFGPTVLVPKRAPGGAWSYAAEAFLPSRGPLATFTTWASTAKGSGLLGLVADPQHARAWAHVLGFRADGGFLPAEPVGTPYDLGPRPRGCTAAERAATPRLAVPLRSHGTLLFPGTRHPVLVFEAKSKPAPLVGEPMVLLTSGAVLHGTPSSPCLAAFQAESAERAPIAAMIAGDLARSWIFRRAPDDAPTARGRRRSADPNATRPLEYRPMTCHYDPSAPIPDVVWSQDGTSSHL